MRATAIAMCLAVMALAACGGEDDKSKSRSEDRRSKRVRDDDDRDDRSERRRKRDRRDDDDDDDDADSTDRLEKYGEEQQRLAEAKAAALKAAQEANTAREALDRLTVEMRNLDTKTKTIIEEAVNAADPATQRLYGEKLESVKKERAELERRIAEAQAAAARLERLRGAKVSKECQDNPLAKGCM